MKTTSGAPTAEASLGAQVRAARASKGLSLRDLARVLGVSPATLSQIENGRTGLTVSRLSRIADVLDLTVAQILDFVVPAAGPNQESSGRRHSCPRLRRTGVSTVRSSSTRS